MDRDVDEVSDEERVGRKLEIDRLIHNIVYKNLRKNYEKNANIYNLRNKASTQSYAVGQKVLKRNFQQSSAIDSYNAKLGPMYLPCTVMARIGTSSYELANEQGKSLGIFSAADIKPDDS